MKAYLGKIVEVNYEKSLVKVDYQGTISDFMPYKQVANSYVKIYTPARVGEQVSIIELDGGFMYAIASFFNADFTSNGDEFTHKITYEDGTELSYNTKSNTLEINAVKTINISCVDCNVKASNVDVNCSTLNASANTTTITSPSINLNGNTNIAGGISTSGAKGDAGDFKINGSLNITGSITAGGTISDSKGDLTNHTHSCTCGATATSR